MSQAVPSQHFPRPVLIAAAGVIGFTILAAGYGRLAGPHDVMPAETPLAARDLRFDDRQDGAVVVRDADTGKTVEVFAPTTNAFVRATMRGLAQQRMRENLGPQTPFRLAAWADGRLTLQDPATGRVIEVEAFGHDNAKVFAALLSTRESAP